MVGCCCKSYYFVLTLVRENHILVREKSGNFKIDLLCEPCNIMVMPVFYITTCGNKQILYS